jgi:hypothetical protein
MSGNKIPKRRIMLQQVNIVIHKHIFVYYLASIPPAPNIKKLENGFHLSALAHDDDRVSISPVHVSG